MKTKHRSRRESSVVKNTYYFAEDTVLVPETHIGGSQLPVTLVSGDPIPSYGLHRLLHSLIHITKEKKSLKKKTVRTKQGG